MATIYRTPLNLVLLLLLYLLLLLFFLLVATQSFFHFLFGFLNFLLSSC